MISVAYCDSARYSARKSTLNLWFCAEFSVTARGTDTALSTAAAAGNAMWFRTVLEAGPLDVDALDGCGLTPLYFAVLESHYDVLDILLEAGADPLGGRGEPPLKVAMKIGNIAVMARLLEFVPPEANLPASVVDLSWREGWHARHADAEHYAQLDGRGQLFWSAIERLDSPLYRGGRKQKPWRIEPDGTLLYLDEDDRLYNGQEGCAVLLNQHRGSR